MACCECGFLTCGPNEVIVITGVCVPKPVYISGGSKFVMPCLQRAERLNLNIMTLTIDSPRIYTKLGVPITVTGVAQVKFMRNNWDVLRLACEQFLGKELHEVRAVAQATLEGHQRAIMGNMTVEDIYRDRKKFSEAVFEVASSDLVRMGMQVISYTIKDVKDDEGYLASLGQKRTAEVKRDARVGEATAQKDSGIRLAMAEKDTKEVRFVNDIAKAKANRDFKLKEAEYNQTIQAAVANADLAYSLQAAKTRQDMRLNEMQVQVVERTQQVKIEELEIERKTNELKSQVNKPAEAQKFKVEKLAESEKIVAVVTAEAEAAATQTIGEANAFSIEVKAKAEAEQMLKKAEAWEEYNSAAKLQMVLDKLPSIIAEVASPLEQGCQKVTMISCGPASVPVGPEKVTGEVMRITRQLPDLVGDMTGIDARKIMSCST